jgi:hypothetical protein
MAEDSMKDDTVPLPLSLAILTIDQVAYIDEAIARVACIYGFGVVRIVIEKGHPRFIIEEVSKPLPRPSS